MNKRLLSTVTWTLLLSGAGFAQDTAADPAHDHQHGDGGPHATIVPPRTLAGLWAHINAYGRTVVDAAEAEDAAVLHKQQVNLEALISALGPASQGLDPAKQLRAEGMIRNSQRALEHLHVATDIGDFNAVRKAANSLTGVLSILKAQYPKDITAGLAEVQDDIGPHEGILAQLNDSTGKPAGHLELKLHDDKGDLELWLAKDRTISQPLDLPLDANITIAFAESKVKSVALAIRNAETNKDEDGNPTIRDGRTNYFIFPGDSGADATWLTGANFEAEVKVNASSSGGNFESETFLLIPHTHHDH